MRTEEITWATGAENTSGAGVEARAFNEAVWWPTFVSKFPIITAIRLPEIREETIKQFCHNGLAVLITSKVLMLDW